MNNADIKKELADIAVREDDITQRVLNQAQLILEYQEREKGLQKAAQLKEGYIHDLMGAHQKLIAQIQQVCVQLVEHDKGNKYLADAISETIDSPPATVASEREARLAVFNTHDQSVADRITESAAHAKAKRLEGGE